MESPRSGQEREQTARRFKVEKIAAFNENGSTFDIRQSEPHLTSRQFLHPIGLLLYGLWEDEEMTLSTGGIWGAQPLTRTEWADQQLRAAILRGELRPGDQVVISTLAEQLGVSATPLREALRNLASEGLVELQAHGSARVATVNINEAVDLYEMRLALEPMALERSVAKSDDAYRARLQAAWIAMTESAEPTLDLHIVFHRVLLSACDSAWMLRVTNMLADRTALMMVIGLETPPPNYDIAKSHRAMFDKSMAGDAAGASDELSQHLKGTLDLFNMLRLDATSTTAD